jgi:hypothetical protein
MKETVWYFPEGDMILIKTEYLDRDRTRVWCGEDGNFYWSDLLDNIPNFIFLGDL